MTQRVSPLSRLLMSGPSQKGTYKYEPAFRFPDSVVSRMKDVIGLHV